MSGGVLAEVPSIITDAGAFAAALLAIGAFVAGVYRVPFVRRSIDRWWQPRLAKMREVDAQIRHEAMVAAVRPALQQLLPNGGSSVRDAIDRIGDEVGALRDDTREALAETKANRAAIAALADEFHIHLEDR